MIRWPGVIKPGTVSNEICAHEDMLPTLLAAAGVPDVKEKLLTGYKAGDKTFKVHLDGYNLVPLLKGEVKESPRKEMLYWSDDGDLMALRYENWKAVFKEQRAESFQVWSEPMVDLRVPKIFNLRSDPFEKADKNSIYPCRPRCGRRAGGLCGVAGLKIDVKDAHGYTLIFFARSRACRLSTPR